MQVVVQNNIISAALKPGDRAAEAPLVGAADQCRAVAAGHHRAVRWAWRPPRTCALAGGFARLIASRDPALSGAFVAAFSAKRRADFAPQPMIENPPSTGMAVPVTKSDAREREEHRDAREVVDRAPARRGRARQHLVVQAVDLLARAPGQVGVDPARQHRVDLDVVGGPGHRAGAA